MSRHIEPSAPRPLTLSRLMDVVVAGERIAAAYGALCAEMQQLSRLAQEDNIDLPTIAYNINRQIVGANLLIVEMKHILDLERQHYHLRHKQNEHARRSMSRARARKSGRVPTDERLPFAGHPVYLDEMNPFDVAVGPYNPNDLVTQALSDRPDGTDGATLQFEPVASPPSAEEQALALALALAADPPEGFAPKGITPIEYEGRKLI